MTKMAGTVVPAPHQSKSVPMLETRRSGPPINPSQAIHLGTRPELYIR